MKLLHRLINPQISWGEYYLNFTNQALNPYSAQICAIMLMFDFTTKDGKAAEKKLKSDLISKDRTISSIEQSHGQVIGTPKVF